MIANGKGPRAFELTSNLRVHGNDRKQWRSRRPGFPHGLTVLCIAVVLMLVASSPAFSQAGPAATGLAANASNAETVYLNPAGMTRLDGMQFSGAPSIAYYNNEFRILPGSTEGAGTSIKDSGFVGIPSAALSYQINDQWWVGIGLTIPVGIGSDWPDNWAGRYITQESTFLAVAATPAVAYRVNDWFSIGAGVNLSYVSAQTRAAINNVADNVPDGRVEYEGDGFGVGGTLSFLFEPSERTRFGLVYRSETQTDVEDTPQFTNLGPIREAVLQQLGVLGAPVETVSTIPQSVGAGVYHELTDDWSVTADLVWADFSEFGFSEVTVGDTSVAVSSSFEDIWAGSVGVGRKLNEKWAVSAGAMYASSGADAQSRTLSLLIDRIWGVGIGADYALSERKDLGFSLTYFDLGDSYIDTQPTPLSGRVVGAFDHRYAIALMLSHTIRF